MYILEHYSIESEHHGISGILCAVIYLLSYMAYTIRVTRVSISLSEVHDVLSIN